MRAWPECEHHLGCHLRWVPHSGNALKRNQNVNTTKAVALGGTLILVMPSTVGLTYHFFWALDRIGKIVWQGGLEVVLKSCFSDGKLYWKKVFCWLSLTGPCVNCSVRIRTRFTWCSGGDKCELHCLQYHKSHSDLDYWKHHCSSQQRWNTLLHLWLPWPLCCWSESCHNNRDFCFSFSSKFHYSSSSVNQR
jgi:hypothetical protein